MCAVTEPAAATEASARASLRWPDITYGNTGRVTANFPDFPRKPLLVTELVVMFFMSVILLALPTLREALCTGIPRSLCDKARFRCKFDPGLICPLYLSLLSRPEIHPCPTHREQSDAQKMHTRDRTRRDLHGLPAEKGLASHQ